METLVFILSRAKDFCDYLVRLFLIYRGVGGIAKGSAQGTGTSSARKTLQWSVFSEMGPAGLKNREQEKPRTGRYSQAKASAPATK